MLAAVVALVLLHVCSSVYCVNCKCAYVYVCMGEFVRVCVRVCMCVCVCVCA